MLPELSPGMGATDERIMYNCTRTHIHCTCISITPVRYDGMFTFMQHCQMHMSVHHEKNDAFMHLTDFQIKYAVSL